MGIGEMQMGVWNGKTDRKWHLEKKLEKLKLQNGNR
jgi:hypothetical protein